MKATFVVVEGVLAIAFGACGRKPPTRNAGAILEWVIAFIFALYAFSFVIDLLPSVRTRRHIPQGEKIEMARGGPTTPNPPDAIIDEPLTMDSTGPSAGFYRGQRI